uniref:ABC transporter domain-containing protein n=1 Tax=Macrostomum lignano TaxID=282301 RepID=A0A1I8J122_9PLAT
ENVLCESLTVWESVLAILVSRGRDTPEQRAASKKLLERLGLSGDRVLNRPATALSGGQQRKLCATLALAGDPELVLLDEPSSGLDPLSRRSLWSALSENRAGRCLLLSTQFMDEADLLADRKLLLRDGELKCIGSSLFMKQKYNSGCVIHVAAEQPTDLVKKLKKAFKTDIKAVVMSDHEIEIRTPENELVKQKKQPEGKSNVKSFGLSLTGLESVFEQQGEAADAADSAVAPKALADATIAAAAKVARPSVLSQFAALLVLSVRRLYRSCGRICCRLVLPLLLFAAFIILLVFSRISHDSPPHGVNSEHSVRFEWLRGFSEISGICLTDVGSELPSVDDCDTLLTGGGINYAKKILVLSKPADMSLPAFLSLQHTQDKFRESCSYAWQCPLAYASNWSLADGAEGNAGRSVYFGYFIDESKSYSKITAGRLIKGYSRLAKYFNLRLCKIPERESQLSADNSSFSFIGATIRNPLSVSVYFNTPMLALLLMIAVTPVGMLSDPIEDQSSGLRCQLRAMGVSSIGYWTSTCLLHWLQYMLLCLPAVVAMVIVMPSMYANAYFLVGVFPVLLLLGLPVNQLVVYAASTWVRRANAIATGLLFVVCFACGGLSPLLVNLSNYIGLCLAALWPPYAVIGLPFYASNLASNAAEFYGTTQLDRVPSLSGIYFSHPLLVLCLVCVPIHALLLCGLLAVREFGLGTLMSAAVRRCRCDRWLPSSSRIRDEADHVPMMLVCVPAPAASSRVVEVQVDSHEAELVKLASTARDGTEAEPAAAAVEDIGVQKERDRLLKKQPVTFRSGSTVDEADKAAQNDSVQVLSLAKRYPGAPSRAVNDVTFGARAGQIFGLLGPNGAGKSTTLSVLVGERSASQGRCLVDGSSGREAARLGKIGYCPQYSPLLPTITVLEHLQFYARVRGLPSESISQQSKALAEAMGLAKYLHLSASGLSGGNRRRLCLAIALLGNPSVLVIDEASTGVDPENKRSIWKAVRAAAGSCRAVVLTTHSMEEAEALCSKYGKNYTLDVQMKRDQAGPASGSGDSSPDEISDLLKICFKNYRKVEDFHAWCRYEVELKDGENALSEALEELKNSGLVESYALYQASLDQIFIGLLEGRNLLKNELEEIKNGRIDEFLRLVASCGGGRREAGFETSQTGQTAGGQADA